MLDEGYVKYRSIWKEGPPPPEEEVRELIAWRDRLHRLGLVGVYPDGIGFGNVSLRAGGEEFLITGTQTGHIPELRPEHLVRVTGVDIAANTLTCHGPVQASSEGMTHAALYRCDPAIGAVIHVHHPATWSALLELVPTTSASVPYGTPEMAWEIERLYRQSDLPGRKFLAMAGHREGLISFGASLEEAGEILLRDVRL